MAATGTAIANNKTTSAPVTKASKKLKRRRKTFLKALANNGGQVAKAARAAGYANSGALRKHYDNDANFAAQWDAAAEAAADDLESEAIRRARDGVYKPVWYRGECVGHTIEFSDTLLMFMLKGARPDKFAERKKVDTTVDGEVGVVLLPATMVSNDDWMKAAAGVKSYQDKNKHIIDEENVVDVEYTEIKKDGPGPSDTHLDEDSYTECEPRDEF